MADPKPGPEEVLLRKERARRIQHAAERLGASTGACSIENITTSNPPLRWPPSWG